jgi:hypothetical protein
MERRSGESFADYARRSRRELSATVAAVAAGDGGEDA